MLFLQNRSESNEWVQIFSLLATTMSVKVMGVGWLNISFESREIFKDTEKLALENIFFCYLWQGCKALYDAYNHGLWTPDEAFFHWYPKLSTEAQTNWTDKVWCILGIYKTIEANANTDEIPTTRKSYSLYRELLNPILGISLASIR